MSVHCAPWGPGRPETSAPVGSEAGAGHAVPALSEVVFCSARYVERDEWGRPGSFRFGCWADFRSAPVRVTS